VPDEQAFEAIKSSLDSVPKGTKMVLNSGEFCSWRSVTKERLIEDCIPGEFYGSNSSAANLELLARFFHKYPEYAEKAFLSVKVRQLMDFVAPCT
jgi:pyridoxine 4-dehydrogenase